MDNQKLFNDKSELYESSRPVYPTEVYKYLASLCPSNNLAWDCACGNGQAAISLVKEFGNIYANDVSREQIKNAKIHPRINYVISPSEKVNLENESCDLVCVAQALHWFNFELFWPEVQRVLKSGGVFSAYGYNWPSINNEIDYVIDNFIMDTIKPFWAPQNKLIWNHYRDIDFPFKRIVSPKFTMVMSWDLNEYFNFLHTWSAIRRCMDSLGNDFFYKAYSQVCNLWGGPETRKEITLDFVFYAGRKKT